MFLSKQSVLSQLSLKELGLQHCISTEAAWSARGATVQIHNYFSRFSFFKFGLFLATLYWKSALILSVCEM